MIRASTVIASVVAALCLAATGSAAASAWQVEELNGGDVQAHLYGAACPTNNLCVAVGGDGTIATSSDPLGGAGAWRVFRPTGGFQPEGLETGPEPSFGGAQLKDVDCPGAGECVAASFDGRIFSSTDPAAGPKAWKAIELTPPKTPRVHMLGISCPTAGLCVAAAYGGVIAYSTHPTGEAADWQIVKLAEPHDFRGISCASASLCVAVGLEGEIVSSTDPTGGPEAWVSAGAPAGPERLSAVDCPSAALCVSANSSQILTSTNPSGGASAWRAVPAGTGIPVTGISCPTASACAAVDQNADVIVSTDPLGGASAWSFKNVLSFKQGMEETGNGNGMFGLDCASATLCAGVGSRYQVIASGNPFAPDEQPVYKGGGRRGRPRVAITGHPAKRLEPHRGGVRVGFAFRAIGKASGFRCKLSGRGRFRPCRSPVHYRVKAGARVFRVRAIGPGGLKGPTASFHFRVGHLSESAPAGSCQGVGHGTRGCVNGGA